MKRLTITTLLFFMVAVTLSPIAQASTFPNVEVLSEGTGVDGTFPASVTVLDQNYRQYAPSLATPSLIRLTYEFDLNPLSTNVVYILLYATSNSALGEYRYRVQPSSTYNTITKGTTATWYTWVLSTEQAQTKPVQLEFEFTCVPGGVDCEESALYIDYVYIDSSTTDPGILDPNQPPPDIDDGDTEEQNYWLWILPIVIFLVTLVALMYIGVKPSLAIILALVFSAVSFLLLNFGDTFFTKVG